MSEVFKGRNLFDDFQNGFWSKDEKNSNENSHYKGNLAKKKDFNQHINDSLRMDKDKISAGPSIVSEEEAQTNDHNSMQISQKMSNISDSDSEDKLYIDLKYSESDVAGEENVPNELESKSSDDSPNECLSNKEETSCALEKVNSIHTDLLENCDKCPERKRNDLNKDDSSAGNKSVSFSVSTGLKDSIQTDSKLSHQDIFDRKVEKHCEKVSLSESKLKNQQDIESIAKSSKAVMSNNQLSHKEAENGSFLDEKNSEQNNVNVNKHIHEKSADQQSNENPEKHLFLNTVCAHDDKKIANECITADLRDTKEFNRIKDADLNVPSKDVKDSTEDCEEICKVDNPGRKTDDCFEIENARSPNASQEKSLYHEKTAESEEEHGRTWNVKVDEVLDKSTDIVGQKALETSKKHDNLSSLDEANSGDKSTDQKESITSESDLNASCDESSPSSSNAVTSADTNNQRMFTTNFSFKYIEADKTFKCSCSFCTDSEMIFEIHLIVNHLVFRPYRCFYCKSCFESMDEIKIHQTAAHPNKLQKSSLIGMKKAKWICLKSKSQGEYIHRQRKPSSDEHNHNAEMSIEEGIEVKNDESDTAKPKELIVSRKRSDCNKHDGRVDDNTSTVLINTTKASDEISNVPLKVVTPGNQLTETVVGNSDRVGWSSAGLVQQPNISFSRFPLIPAIIRPRNAVKRANATGIAKNTVSDQQQNVALSPVVPIMNRPMIPFAPGSRPGLHMKTNQNKPMPNTAFQHLPMGMHVQDEANSSKNINLPSELGHHQFTSRYDQNSVQNSVVICNSTNSKSNSSSNCSSSENFTYYNPAEGENVMKKTITRQSDVSDGSWDFNQASFNPGNPPNMVDCIMNASSLNPPTSAPLTISNTVLSPVINPTHHLPSWCTSITSSLCSSLYSATYNSGTSVTSYENTSSASNIFIPTTSSLFTGSNPIVSRLSTSSNSTMSSSSTVWNPRTSNLSTGSNPTTSNLSTGSNPTTSNTFTSSDLAISTRPVSVENDQHRESAITRESMSLLQERINRITKVFKFENNVYLCKNCSTKWSERVKFWFHIWKHIHYKNGPCLKCNIEKSDCSMVEGLLFTIENESKYRKIINKFDLSKNNPQNSKASDANQFPSLESSFKDTIIIKNAPSPIFIDLLDDYVGEQNFAVEQEHMQTPEDSPLVTVQKFIANNGHLKTPKDMSSEEFIQKKHKLASEITTLIRNITEENGKPVSGQTSEQLERIREIKKLELFQEILSKSISSASNESLISFSENNTTVKGPSSCTTLDENSSEASRPTIRDSKENKDAVANSSCVTSGKDRMKLAERINPQFYACSLCPYSTLGLANYRKHLLNEHSKQTIMCIHCGFKADSTESSVKHLLHHSKAHNPKVAVFQCYQKHCPYQCNTLRDFMKHVKGHTDYEYKCHCCESSYNSVNELQEHYQHSFLTIVTCPTCRARSTDKQSMLKHIAKHHPDKGRMLTMVKQLICKERKENNFSYDKLKELQREWANVEDDDIEIIEKTPVDGPIVSTEKDKDDGNVIVNENSKERNESTGQTLLVENMSVSSIDENQSSSTTTSGYICDKCSFVAEGSSSLDDHISKHQDLKPLSLSNDYSCSLCPTYFNQFADFYNHLQQHDEKVFYTIYECTSTDGYKTNILSKIIEHVKDDFHEKACRKDGNLYSDYVVMLETKVLHCSHCPYKCLSKKDLFDHKKSHGINSDSESLCKDTSSHVVCITEAKNKGGEDFDTFDEITSKFYNRVKGIFSCKLCDKKFKFKKLLHIHLHNHIDIPFQCASCWFSSKHLSSVTTHIKNVHHSEHIKINFSEGTTKRLQKLLPHKPISINKSKVRKKSTSACLKSQKSTQKAKSCKTSLSKHNKKNELKVFSEEDSGKTEVSVDMKNEVVESTKEMFKASDSSADIFENAPKVSGSLNKGKTKTKMMKSSEGIAEKNAEILSNKKSGISEEQKTKAGKDSTTSGKRTADNFSLFMSSRDEAPKKKRKKSSSDKIPEKETKNGDTKSTSKLEKVETDEAPKKKRKKSSSDKIPEKETKNGDTKSTSKLEKVETNDLKKSLKRDVAQNNIEYKEAVSISEHSVPKSVKKGESSKQGSAQYKCPKCTFQTVFNERLMRSHLETHNFINIYECKKCSVKFHSFQQIKCHINFLHHGSMDFNLIPVIDIPLEAVYKKEDVFKTGNRKSSNKEAHSSKQKKSVQDSEKRQSIADDKSKKKEMDSTKKPEILIQESKSENETYTNSEESNLHEISSNDENDFIVLDDVSQENTHASLSVSCVYCHEKFTCVNHVSKHIKKSHGQRKKVCWKDVKSGCEFDETGLHIRQSNTCCHKNRFLCPFCSCRSKYRGRIHSHLRKAHKENPPRSAIKLTEKPSSPKKSSGSDLTECTKTDVLKYLCPACNYGSHQLCVYGRHLAKHKRFVKVTKQKIWKCSVCTKRIFKKENIKIHSCVVKCDTEKSLNIVYRDVNRCVNLNPKVKVVNVYTSMNFY